MTRPPGQNIFRNGVNKFVSMAAINNPQLVWINGRCHRINPTTDKANVEIESNVEAAGQLAAYEEPDLYGEDDRDFEGEIQMVNNKFVSSVVVPT